MYRILIMITLYLSALATTHSIPLVDNIGLNESCRNITIVTAMSQRKLKHTPHLRATCKRKDGLATEKTTLLELNLCLGWNKKTETLYRQMNGQGLARGACWGCRYQALGGSGPRFGCYCAEVSNPVEVPGSDEEGAWVQFDLDSAVDVSNNGRLKCRTPQVGTKNKAAL